VAALADPELEQIADAMQGIRGGRHTALYGDEDELQADDLEKASALVARLLDEVYRWLTSTRPSLASRLGAVRR
jgi:hypothetical protein